jgi:2-polyprenyl-3-methyl-5-hydroxy-6-metoxy-1,4-benzoquinol methylase
MSMVKRIDRRFYPNHQKNWDDQLFRERILQVIGPQTRLLDLGAGAGILQAMNFRELAGQVCGVDLDPRVEQNPFLDEGRVAEAGEIPYPDASFDVVVADNVMEHLDHPDQVFREIARVLRPGGKLLFKTPNRSHYMPLIARLTPHRFHQWVNRLRGRHETDTFPTRYLCNSPAQVRRIAATSGLQIECLELIEGRPEYLRITTPTYLVGLAYERLVNSAPSLARFRILLVATLSKAA